MRLYRILKFLNKLNLAYKDPREEQEYLHINTPLLKDFLLFLVICMTLTIIPFSVYLFISDFAPQAYTAIGLLLLLVLIFAFRNKLGNRIQYVIVFYLLLVIILSIINLSNVLRSIPSCEAFYIGYTFALLHRVLGYRIVKVHIMILFHIISLVLRLYFLYDHAISISLIVTAVELLTLGTGIKSEIGERTLFDSLYQSKTQLVKFKDFLTEHLPSQMTILARDYSEAFYMNESFKQYFQCDDLSQVKQALGTLLIEKESIEKDSVMTGSFFSPKERMSFSKFLATFAESAHIIKTSEILTFQVYENERSMFSNRNSFMREDSVLQNQQTRTSKKLLTRFSTLFARRKDSQSYLAGPGDLSDLSHPNLFHQTSKMDFMDRKKTVVEEDRRRVFEVKMFLLPWGGTDAIALVLNDITQQRTIMELKIADKNKDLVIATVSHELRTPLHGILGLIEIMKKMVDDKEVISHLNACKNSGVFLMTLVNSILDMSQIRENRLKLIYTEVCVESLMTEIQCLFESFCASKKLYLKVEVSTDVPKVIVTDKNRLSQVLINLLGNAFKFTYEGGITIKIDLEKKIPHTLKFTVQDTGLGIDKEDQKKLFKMYGRLEQLDKKLNTGGVGLGLTISNTLAVLLNPSEKQGITLESEVGKGSTFSFIVEIQPRDILSEEKSADSDNEVNSSGSHHGDYFETEQKLSPYLTTKAGNFDVMRDCRRHITYQESMVTGTGHTEANEKVPFNKDSRQRLSILLTNALLIDKKTSPEQLRKIVVNQRRHVSSPNPTKHKEFLLDKPEADKPWCLIVDDNPFNLMVARHIMEERGYNIKTAMNGKEGVQEVQGHHAQGRAFKLVLMDCQMPVMDGYEATTEINKMIKNGEIGQCPIIALTANMRDEDHETRWKEAGMTGSLAKPLQIEELERMIKKLER